MEISIAMIFWFLVVILLILLLLNFQDRHVDDYLCSDCLHKNPEKAEFCELCGSTNISQKYRIASKRIRYVQFYLALKRYELLPPLDADEPEEQIINELFSNLNEKRFSDDRMEKGLKKFIKKHRTKFLKTFFLEEQLANNEHSAS
ncbi:MAG: hypothetical protein D6732_18710 [Methanobacteriota archaeon]|nr:MAG: hypothetical protein D6732_18710 [Euryarchaeota archaeon]